MKQEKGLLTTYIVIAVAALISIILSQFYDIFVSITMFVVAVACIVLAYTNIKNKKKYVTRVDGWEEFIDEKDVKQVENEKRTYRIRTFFYIFLAIILIWSGFASLF